MSQYQHGYSGYYGQPNNNNTAPHHSQPQSQAHAPSQYPPYTPSNNNLDAQHTLRRVPSYVAGDDSTYIDEPQPQGFDTADTRVQYGSPARAPTNVSTANQYNYAQNNQNNLGSIHSQISHGSSLHSNPSRASSHSSSIVSGYQPAYQPSVSNNPQPYQHSPRPHSHSQPVASTYNPQAYAHYTTATQPYQPYTPAAYQSTYSSYGSPHLQRYPTTASSSGYTSPPNNPPPVPPRAPDHPYGGRNPSLSPQQNQVITPDAGSTYSSPYLSQSSPSTEYPTAAPSRQHSQSVQSSSYFQGTPYAANPAVSPYQRDEPPPPPAHGSYSDSPYDRPVSTSRIPSHGSTSASSPSNQNPPYRTDTLTRHPTLRPLPGPPADEDHPSTASSRPLDDVGGSAHIPADQMSSDELIKQLEADLTSRPLSIRQSHSPRTSGGGSVGTYAHDREDANSRPTTDEPRVSPDDQHAHTNGSVVARARDYDDYDPYSDDSDAEAAAGLAMMREAEGEGLGTSATLFGSSAPPVSLHGVLASDGSNGRSRNSSYPSTLGGGLQPTEPVLSSIVDREEAPANGAISNSNSMRSSNRSTDGRLPYADDEGYFPIPDDPQLPLPPLPYPPPAKARVDRGGTGGLSEPGAMGRRMSFDDEDEDRPGDHSPERGGEPAELFFHPGMRPLPPAPPEPERGALRSELIPAGTYPISQSVGQPYPQRPLPYPTLQESPYARPPISTSPVPRSTSMVSHSSSPRNDPPIRSKTDADRAKYKQAQELSRQSTGSLGYNAMPGAVDVGLNLPTIPAGRRKKFNPDKLSMEQYDSCSEPWALSSITTWVKDLSEDETYLREQSVIDAIVALFTHKVPTMNIADAETLSARVVKNMVDEGVLVRDEEWVKFTQESLSGVLFQITGKGCYSSRLHDTEVESLGRCYSYHCMRTLKKVNLRTQAMAPQRKLQDWVSFYNVTKEMLAPYPKKEIDRQNNLHEIVTTEDAFIGQLDVLRELYRDQLASMNPPIINPKRLTNFLKSVFGKVDAVKRVNEEYLLAQLKYRQKEQGPFITGFSDIFREWIRKAKSTYIDYAATFPQANYLVRQEAERNLHFRNFLDQARENRLSNRLSWDTFLKAPITRIQRYTLLLSTVHKNMVKDSEEKSNLAQAIEEIKVVALECDNKVGEMSKKIDLKELGAKLKLRPEMKNEVELNLEHLGRQIIYQGDLQRPGNRTRFNIVDTHAILFDHYLVLAKLAVTRDPYSGLKVETYDISKLPIPMDLLVLESTNDDLVVRSSVKGISTLTPAAAATALGGTGPGTLTHTNSSSTTASTSAASGKSFQSATTVDTSNDKILYPFKVKHLGKDGSYTLFAHSAHSRQEWCEKIIEAKTKHAASLFAQNAEPFRLNVLADAAFAFSEPPGPKSVTIRGTPLDRAVKEVEERYANVPRPPPSCRASVNCATAFQQPPGQLKCAIGTDYGLWISDYNDPRGWIKALPITKVTQIAVFEEFNIMLIIADKSLVAYHLDVVVPISGLPQTAQQDSARRAPQKLSGSREVGFFAAGRMKDRTLVIYKKRDGISSKFKVLEPVLQRGTNSRSRFMPGRRGRTDFFRDYGDEFYIPAESYNINLFHSSLAISTIRGMEILTLEVKNSFSVPVLQSSSPDAQKHLTSIGNRIKDLRPLGMFRLSESEFLVAYTECAVYINSTGDISRGVVMEFVGRAHTACLYGRFLILLNDDFVEVRNAENGRLRQVIPGRNVVCLDDGGNMAGSGSSGLHASSFAQANGVSSTTEYARAGRTVKIAMQHPEFERSQVVVELIENEGQED